MPHYLASLGCGDCSSARQNRFIFHMPNKQMPSVAAPIVQANDRNLVAGKQARSVADCNLDLAILNNEAFIGPKVQCVCHFFLRTMIRYLRRGSRWLWIAP